MKVSQPLATGEFKRAMGLLDATAVVVGSMIGSGIFIVSAETSKHLGSPGWLLLAWLAAGVLTISAAMCYSELASMFPKAGGQYVFLREAYGKLAAFLYGWTLFAVIQAGTIAAVAVAFAKFSGVFVPYISKSTVYFSQDLPFGVWKFTALQAVAILIIAIVTAINCFGIKTAKFIQTTFTVCKVFALIALVILGLISFDKWGGLSQNMANFWQPVDLKGNALAGFSLMAVFALAMVGPLFASDAWNNITFAGEEVKDAEKVLPRSLMCGTALVGLLYVLTNIVYLLLLPLHGIENGGTVLERGIQFAAEERVGTAAAQILFGPVSEQIMALAIMISTFGCLNGLVLAGPRAYYAMARDGLFFKGAGVLNAETNVPVFGIILQGIWASLLAMSGTYSNLLEYVVFAALAFYVLTVGALFILRKRAPDAKRPFRVPGYPILPAFYVVAAAIIMVGQMCASPAYSGAGLLIILSGLPAYWYWHSKTKGDSGGE